MVNSEIDIHILTIYAYNNVAERATLWLDLIPIINTLENLDVCRDFNEVLDANERSDGVIINFSQDFWDFLNGVELHDLPLHGRSYTWNNSLSYSRINRVLVSSNIASRWPFQIINTVDTTISDHFPIIFKSDVNHDWDPKPFYSLNVWREDDRFHPFFKISWETIYSNQNACSLFEKLKMLRKLVSTWNK